MVLINCTKDDCETEFDTEREPVARGGSTNRCPACGLEHDVSAAADSHTPDERGATADVRTDGGAIEAPAGATIHITIEIVAPDDGD